MLNLIIAALVAVCVAFPGEVRAEQLSSKTSVTFMQKRSKIDPSKLDKIMQKVVQKTEHSYACLCKMYDDGRLVVGKDSPVTYKVKIHKADGGITVISILDDF